MTITKKKLLAKLYSNFRIQDYSQALAYLARSSITEDLTILLGINAKAIRVGTPIFQLYVAIAGCQVTE